MSWLKKLRGLSVVCLLSSLMACSDDRPAAVNTSKSASQSSVEPSSSSSGLSAVQPLLAIFPQAINSSAWNQGGYNGAKNLSASLGMPFHYLESVQSDDVERFKQDVGAEIKRYNVGMVLVHGGQFVAVATALAKSFPRVNFIVDSDCGGNNANLGCLSFDWEELGQIVGVAAGLKSQTGKIGFIGGMRLSILQHMAKGMLDGAHYINPKIEFTEFYLESWNDEVQALVIAKEMIKQGVDVVAINADPASLKLYSLFAQAGVAVIGRDLQLYPTLPESMLANVRLDASHLIQYGLSQVLQGRWEGKLYRFGADDQVQHVDLAVGALDPSKNKRFEALAQEIVTGKLELGH